MAFLILLISVAICGILYRAGGMGKEDTAEPRWIPKWLRKSWVRDWLCPLVVLIALWLLVGFKLSYWWIYAIFWGLSGGALSTYFDFTGSDNFYLHGLGCGLAGLPLCMVIPWWVVSIRAILCMVGMGLWSKWVSKDWLEEIGRGVLFIL
jgi:hypothetical protein